MPQINQMRISRYKARYQSVLKLPNGNWLKIRWPEFKVQQNQLHIILSLSFLICKMVIECLIYKVIRDKWVDLCQNLSTVLKHKLLALSFLFLASQFWTSVPSKYLAFPHPLYPPASGHFGYDSNPRPCSWPPGQVHLYQHQGPLDKHWSVQHWRTHQQRIVTSRVTTCSSLLRTEEFSRTKEFQC